MCRAMIYRYIMYIVGRAFSGGCKANKDKQKTKPILILFINSNFFDYEKDFVSNSLLRAYA